MEWGTWDTWSVTEIREQERILGREHAQALVKDVLFIKGGESMTNLLAREVGTHPSLVNRQTHCQLRSGLGVL